MGPESYVANGWDLGLNPSDPEELLRQWLQRVLSQLSAPEEELVCWEGDDDGA